MPPDWVTDGDGDATNPLLGSIPPPASIPASTLELFRQRRERSQAFRFYKPKAIREQKRYLHCPTYDPKRGISACYPAYLAGRYCRLGWQWAFTLTAHPARFRDYYDEWISHLDGLGAPAFWTYVIVTKHKDGRRGDVLHLHGAIGGVFSYDEMRRLLSEWPGSKPWFRKIRGYKNAWAWLHYIYSQEKVTREDPFAHARDKLSHCHHLLVPPFDSDNLETLTRDYWTAVKRKAGRRSGARKSAAWRVARARKAAQARAAQRAEERAAREQILRDTRPWDG